MKTFRPDSPTPKIKSPETQIPEYSFEEGVQKAVERIQQLFKTLERDVFVVINGSSIEVGKTFLKKVLVEKLHVLGIETTTVSMRKNDPESEIRKVVFQEAIGAYWKTDEKFREAIKKANPDLTPEHYGDLWIGICRPNREFANMAGTRTPEPVADIMICNEHAQNRYPL